jgi:hypothetical protein
VTIVADASGGWARLGADRWLHLSTNVLIYRLSADQMWRVVVPVNGIDNDADMPLSWGSPERVLRFAEQLHAVRVGCVRQTAHRGLRQGAGLPSAGDGAVTRDATGRRLSRADLAELERMNEENRRAAEKARKADENRGK